MMRSCTFVAVLALAGSGCVQEVSQPVGEAPETQSALADGPAQAGHGPQDLDPGGRPSDPGSLGLPASFEENGLRFVALRRNHPERFVPGGVRPPEVAPEVPRDTATMTDAEYAETITGLTVRDDIIYRVEPDLQLVRRLREEQAVRTEPIAPVEAPVGELPAADDALAQAYVIADGRNRRVRRDNTGFAMRTQVQMQNDDGGCSGTLIGRWTLLTASHCLYDGENFRARFTFRPGADAADSNPFPYGEYNCYGATVAGGASPGQPVNDYAVVDFNAHGCGDKPGDLTGGMGTWNQSSAQLGADTLHLYGYPVDHSPYPQILGMSGSTTSIANDWFGFDMDETGGQSGAAIYVIEGSNYYVVGINSGGSFNFNMIENRAARFTQTVRDAVVAWSTEF